MTSVPPYSNPGPRTTRGLNPGVMGPGGAAAGAAGVMTGGAMPARGQGFDIDDSGLRKLQQSVQGVIDKFDELDRKINAVVASMGKLGGGTAGGGTGGGGPSTITAAPISMAAGAEVAAGAAGWINQKMAGLNRYIPIQQMAATAAQFGGQGLTTTMAQFSNRPSLGPADLAQALAMQQANPVLSLMVPGMRGYGNYNRFLTGISQLNPSGGASWAQSFANVLTSPQASQFYQMRGQGAGLLNRQGGINPPQDVLRTLLNAIMVRNVTPQQARALAGSRNFRTQLGQLSAMGGPPLDPSMQTALLAWMGTGENWNKAQQIMGGTVARSTMQKLTAQTQAGAQIFQDTTQLQNTVNTLSADFSKAVKATAVLTPGLFTFAGATAYATKMMLGVASQLMAMRTIMSTMGGGGMLPGGGGGGGGGGVMPVGMPGGSDVAPIAGEAAAARSMYSAASARQGAMLGRLATQFSRVPGISTETSMRMAGGLQAGVLGRLFGGTKGMGFVKGAGIGLLGNILGGLLQSQGHGSGFGSELAQAGGGALKGAGIGTAIMPGFGTAIGAGVGALDAELQKHFFSHWQQSGNPLVSAIGGIGSLAGNILGLGDPLTGSQSTSGMQPNLARGITAMQRANPSIRINSGFRSQSQQKNLYAMKGGQGVARPGQSPHQLGKAADIGPPSQYGWIAQNAGLFGLGTVGSEPWHVQAMGDPSSPVSGLATGRVDQGVDYSGKGTVNAVGAGTIVVANPHGWGSLGNAGLGAIIVLKLDNPPDAQHSMVYYAENIIPSVRVGQHVTAGQVLGTATGTGSGIEIGWADPSQPMNPLAPLDPNATGAQTAAGKNFLAYIHGAAPSSSDSSGSASASSTTSTGKGVVPSHAIGLQSSFVSGLSSFVPFSGFGGAMGTHSGTSTTSAGTSGGSGTPTASAANGTAIPTSGTLTPAQVAAAWIKAGGPANVAKTMAGIAMAESSDQPGAIQKGQPYATTGWGLWQITPGNSEPQIGVDKALLDPVTNAKAALAKYVGAGNTLRPWTGDHYLTGNNISPSSSGVGDPMGPLFTAQGGSAGNGRGPVMGGGGGRSINVTIGPIYVNGTQADANNIANMVAAALKRNQDIAAVGMS